MNICKIWMQLYQLDESKAKKNQPKSKTLFGCRENNRKTQGRKRERERTREEPREMWAMKESRSESERAPFGHIYLLNVLNSLSLKWAFIQYSVIVFQRFTTVDTKFNLFYPQLMKLLIKLFFLNIFYPFLLRGLKRKTKTKYFLIIFFNSYNNCRNKFLNFLIFTLQLYSSVKNWTFIYIF